MKKIITLILTAIMLTSMCACASSDATPVNVDELYVPTYTEPAESLIEVESEAIDTDELTADDWKSIMLDLEQGNISDGTKTFNFIKNNEDTDSDNSLMWMLYLGTGLITIAIFLVIFVVISTTT